MSDTVTGEAIRLAIGKVFPGHGPGLATRRLPPGPDSEAAVTTGVARLDRHGQAAPSQAPGPEQPVMPKH